MTMLPMPQQTPGGGKPQGGKPGQGGVSASPLPGQGGVSAGPLPAKGPLQGLGPNGGQMPILKPPPLQGGKKPVTPLGGTQLTPAPGGKPPGGKPGGGAQPKPAFLPKPGGNTLEDMLGRTQQTMPMVNQAQKTTTPSGS